MALGVDRVLGNDLGPELGPNLVAALTRRNRDCFFLSKYGFEKKESDHSRNLQKRERRRRRRRIHSKNKTYSIDIPISLMMIKLKTRKIRPTNRHTLFCSFFVLFFDEHIHLGLFSPRSPNSGTLFSVPIWPETCREEVWHGLQS
ncbi:MAG: hypothetical protein Q8P67_05045 [archaeon]|nr:hypothetical protein [archaeon]